MNTNEAIKSDVNDASDLNNKTIKILHVEDSLGDSDLVRASIKNASIEYEYFLVDNEKDFAHILATEIIDLIISDYSLPNYSGKQALKLASEKYAHIPFIFV